MNNISLTGIEYDGRHLTGDGVTRTVKTLKDIKGIFSSDPATVAQLPDGQIIYEVESYLPVPAGTLGGLFFGITFIYPGAVGNEYFMTRGHFHKIQDRAEYYWCIEGEGMLLLMDQHRKIWSEKMYPGSLHYINAGIAHRGVNTGSSVLSFGACWPADAGYDYETIDRDGFSKIVVSKNGIPTLMDKPVRTS